MSYLAPTLGFFTASAIFLSPWNDVQESLSANSLEEHNVLPYSMMANNCLVWIIYSFLVKDLFIFFTNIFGWMLSLYYFAAMHGLAFSLKKTQTAAWMLRTLWFGQAVILIGSFFAFFYFGDSMLDIDYRPKNSLGIAAIILLVMFYSSPLITLYKVIRTKNASSFRLGLSLTCFVNALLWTAYGISLGDIFVSGPNATGIIVSFLQLLCLYVYGSSKDASFKHHPISSSDKMNDHSSIELGNSPAASTAVISN